VGSDEDKDLSSGRKSLRLVLVLGLIHVSRFDVLVFIL